jgi:Family of unknown function (DUF6335)
MAKRARPKPKPSRKRTQGSAKGRKRPAPQAKRRSTKRAKPATAKRRQAAKAKSNAKARAGIPTLRTPPSSLDLDRAASAARSGRRLVDANLRRHSRMAALTAGDVDADMESAYFTGDETPGGDNPTPDQNNVDEIGHAVGVEYQANEELKSTDKIDARDRHRWDNE